MVLAISLVKAVPDEEKMVYRALREMEGIKKLYHVFGNHDFFLILEAESMDGLNNLLNKIIEITSVGAIKSMLVRPTGGICMNVCEIKNPICTTV
jgi:DNA-binding Lrp family transcriptional regulator